MKQSEKVIGVLGGGGFLGRYVVNLLASQGYLLKVGGRHPEKYLHLKTAATPGRIQLHKVDVRSEKSLENFITGCDGVVDLVGILFERGQQRFDAVHAKAADVIAKLSTKEGVKHLIYISALGIDQKSTSLYAQTKLLAEENVRNHFPKATILRPSLIFGPEDQFFNRFAAMMRLSPVIPVFKDGRTRFQPVYVMDVARAIAACLYGPLHPFSDSVISVQGQTFELGGPTIFSFQELLEKIMDVTDRSRPIIHLPTVFGYGLSLVSKFLPTPLITMDQLRLLGVDSVCSSQYPGFQDLGIAPESLESVLPTYLNRFAM